MDISVSLPQISLDIPSAIDVQVKDLTLRAVEAACLLVSRWAKSNGDFTTETQRTQRKPRGTGLKCSVLSVSPWCNK